jgi:hypothetical protein
MCALFNRLGVLSILTQFYVTIDIRLKEILCKKYTKRMFSQTSLLQQRHVFMFFATVEFTFCCTIHICKDCGSLFITF